MEAQTTELPPQEWHYEDNGQRKGPISDIALKEMIKTGRLAGDSIVWRKGLTDWVKLEDTEFKAELSERIVPPPLHGEKVNNAVVWILAFAPIIGTLLQGVIAGIVYRNEAVITNASINKLWFVTLILNVALSYYDERRLQAAGHDTSKFNTFVWLVPVYLFQRAKYLKQNLSYFIAWIVSFVVILIWG